MFEQEEPIVYFKSSESMDEIKDNSIQLIITSPPYGRIKDYGSNDQIGYLDSFSEYFKRLKRVWSECYRVLEPQCRVVINVGDQYLRTSQYGRYRILSIASRIINDCIDIGFDYLGDIIWQKVSTTNTTGGCSLMGSIYYPRNGLLTYDYEHILIFKKYRGRESKVDLRVKELSKISLSEWKKWYVGHWRFPGIVQKEHLAMFPDELPYRLIRMFSFIGDTVLDPFIGSGTTLKVAKALFRKGIGYEVNKSFKNIIMNKIKQAKIGTFKDFQYLMYEIFQKSKKENFSINFEGQKRKGIIILKNEKNKEIILDYLLLDDINFQKEVVMKELKSKLEENSVKSYMHEKGQWKSYENYVLIINSKFSNNPEFNTLVDDFMTNLNKSNKFQAISYDQIISDDFKILELFQNP
ncbi:MAG: DNA-methyltransferase [Promethearchaeota archaeon]